ncbi:MAG TPA: hypothetical protein ENK66_03880 [Arcobacter sp.]|nr:hypothetical protein [Arcobacter sp.]
MIKISIIFLFMILAILLFSLSDWYTEQNQKFQAVNNEHLREIRKLRKIKELNVWLQNRVEPFLSSLPNDMAASDKNIVLFFDENSNKFNFKVSKYLYSDELTQNLDILFSCHRSNKKQLAKLIQLQYPTGYIQFRELKTFGKNITGMLQIVQPVFSKGDDNASH